MADLQVQPRVLGHRYGLAEAVHLLVRLRPVRFVGDRQVGEDADHPQQPLLLVLHGPVDQVLPERRRAAVAAQPGIDLQVHACRPFEPPGRLDHRLQFPTGHADVDPRLDARGEVRVRGVQPGQDGRVDARRAQGQPLGEVRNAQPGCPGFQCGPGHRDGAVAVGVRLDHRHHTGRSRDLAQVPHVGADGGQVNDGLAVIGQR